MQINIQYKKIKNARVKFSNDSLINISIPIWMKNDENLKKMLLEKAEIMKKRYEQKIKIISYTDQYITLFGHKYTNNYLPYPDKFFKQKLLEYSENLVETISKKLNVNVNKLIVRKNKSKWGSCNSRKTISLNQNLVHLPQKYIDYVIVHEICHLKYMNHSKKFWELVESFVPDYKVIMKDMKKIVIL